MESRLRAPRDIQQLVRAQTWEELVGALTPEEAEKLQQLLQAPGKRFDILLRLPVDLQLQVLDFIDNHDVWSCHNVSHAWRSMLVQEPFLRQLCKTHFPGLSDSASLKKVDIEVAFHGAARRCYFIAHGLFRSVLYQSLNLEDEPYFKATSKQESRPFINQYPNNNLEVERILYAKGRIAWQPEINDTGDYSCIIVDEFRSRKRKYLKAPRNELMGGVVEIKALGDTYVIAAHRSHLYAWHLDTSAFSSITLPGRGKRVETQGDLALIIGNGGEIYLWKVAEKVSQLKVSGPIEESSSLNRSFRVNKSSELSLLPVSTVDVIISTSPTESFFVVIQDEDQQGQVRLTLFEWQVSGSTAKFTRSHEFQLGSIPNYRPHDQVWMKCRAADSFGTHVIASIWKTEETHDASCRPCSVSNDHHQTPPIISITFNVFTKTFGYQSHHTFSQHSTKGNELYSRAWGEDVELVCHWWNGLCFVWQQMGRYTPPLVAESFPIFAMQPCGSPGLRDPNDTPILYTYERTAETLLTHKSDTCLRVYGPLRRRAHPLQPSTTITCGLLDNPDILSLCQFGKAERVMNTHCEVNIKTLTSEQIAYALDWNSGFDEKEAIHRRAMEGLTGSQCLYIYGDDDFLVCIHDAGYTVFSYCHDFCDENGMFLSRHPSPSREPGSIRYLDGKPWNQSRF